MTTFKKLSLLLLCVCLYATVSAQQTDIPLSEHPRPDFERKDWVNLNGHWDFEFDKNDSGIKERWFDGKKTFSKSIVVPFPWGAPLSGMKDEADIAWYHKEIVINPEWKNKSIFLTIGASDWRTTVWLDGKELGSHEGGYTPFSFELPSVKASEKHQLLIRVDDKRRDFTLYGKQGYGNARGIWQTVYLEARGKTHIDLLHFTPDIDNNLVKIKLITNKVVAQDTPINIEIKGENKLSIQKILPKNQSEISFDIAINQPRLWTLEDPFLYQTNIKLGDDEVNSYFGMRKIATMYLPNTNFKYISLNNKPIYLQLALDQSYHPTGFYTFPSDEFMKNEILLSKKIGLNGIRTHIKVDIPRKLYWADRLGLLVMADLPNFWGEPDAQARKESEYTLKEMIKRDYNHPAIFSWITFNETWGLRTKIEKDGKKQSVYLPETQKWVASVYRLAKSLDASRLVEDNSICCGAGHTETDINSWHEYLPGWAWEKHLGEIDAKTFVGSNFHYENGHSQTDVPNINSECGNVWGYEGSTGDVDWSWDYHRMMNTFRKYPKIAGWLYTEHHDVINEWNGYFRFDRTEKETGVSEILDGMSIKDFHADVYLSTGNEISKSLKPSEWLDIPLYLSSMTDKDLGNELTLNVELKGTDALGQSKKWGEFTRNIPYKPWVQQTLEPLKIQAPAEKSVVTVGLTLTDKLGNIIHRNFYTLVVEAENPKELLLTNGKKAQLLTIEPKNFTEAKWSKKQWNILDGAKVNGAGSGYFSYVISVPSSVDLTKASGAVFVAELGAKQLFVKDMDKKLAGNEDYMLGAKAEPSQNQNAYPMTDASRFPSAVAIFVNGILAGKVELPNDPSDHRGVLSWHNQLQDRKLREAGSYGYRVSIKIPQKAIDLAKESGQFVLKLAVDESLAGGLAIYGDKFGRYPMNPTIAIVE